MTSQTDYCPLAVEANTAQMHRWLVGLVPFHDMVAKGHARMLGPSRLARSFPTWFNTTLYAEGLRRAEQRRTRDALAGDRPAPTIRALSSEE